MSRPYPTPPEPAESQVCVRCGNALGPDDFFEDGETRPHIIRNSDESDERTEGPLCIRDFRIGVGLDTTASDRAVTRLSTSDYMRLLRALDGPPRVIAPVVALIRRVVKGANGD